MEIIILVLIWVNGDRCRPDLLYVVPVSMQFTSLNSAVLSFLCVEGRLTVLGISRSFKSDMAGITRPAFGVEALSPAGRPKNTSLKLGVKRGSEGIMTFGRSLRSGVTRAVFPEELRFSERKILDPQDKRLLFWNRLLVISCIMAVSVDPLFLYLPVFENEGMCLHIDESLAITTTALRTIIDVFYFTRIVLQFMTAYIAPSSRVFGRGELVTDFEEIAKRYLRGYFIVDLCSVLPLPQVQIIHSLIFLYTHNFWNTIDHEQLSLVCIKPDGGVVIQNNWEKSFFLLKQK